ncbi:MAG: hypothetical protein AAB538_03345 [Patescibacteria group bacterium]
MNARTVLPALAAAIAHPAAAWVVGMFWAAAAIFLLYTSIIQVSREPVQFPASIQKNVSLDNAAAQTIQTRYQRMSSYNAPTHPNIP